MMDDMGSDTERWTATAGNCVLDRGTYAFELAHSDEARRVAELLNVAERDHAIVVELAASDVVDGAYCCAFCGIVDRSGEHHERCTWRRAREAVGTAP